MTTKSREYLFSPTVRVQAEKAAAARKDADRLACEAWNARVLDFRGPAPVRRYAYKRSQLTALRPNKITADAPPSEM